EAIPLALAGKDILARAKTGSGKTAAYCLPVIQKILTVKEASLPQCFPRIIILNTDFIGFNYKAIPETSPDRAAIRSLILVPTRELAEQEIKVVNIANTTPVQLQRPILSELPDIIVATPSRALAHLESQRDKTHLRKKDKEYGSSRGIDFINVTAVINFDFPTSTKSYIHRVGRTARASQKGMSLSFVVPKELAGKHKYVSCSSAKHDEEVYARVEKQQSLAGATLRPYFFDMKQVEGFRYRMEDAMRAVTRAAIKEARLKDVRSEILKSETLKTHFEDNPNDLKALRHDTIIHPTRIQQHMKQIPPYLMPKIAAPAANASTDPDHINEESAKFNEYIPFRKKSTNERYHGKKLFKSHKFGPKKRKNDPLKTFKFESTPSKKK
ncbi:215_t:CDS:2, partial [Racocetra fulgida]